MFALSREQKEEAHMSKRRDTEIKSGPHQIGLRIPADLNRELQAIAQRESNGVSAVCRRLIRLGLRAEQQTHSNEAA